MEFSFRLVLQRKTKTHKLGYSRTLPTDLSCSSWEAAQDTQEFSTIL
jgi:hypothetical protein